MAVDFSSRATDVETQIEPEARIIEPVNRQGELDALNQIGRGLGVGARTLGAWFQNRDNLETNKRLASFSLDLSRLQDAEEQGINPNEIRIRGRARLQQELANNPNMEEEVLKRYSTWLNTSGYDKIATPAQQQAAIEQSQIQAAVDNGFLSANDVRDSAKVQAAVDNLENFNTVRRQLETDMKKISLESSKAELTSKQRAELNAKREEVSTTGLQKIAAAALPYWRTQYENIKKAAAQAGTEQERQQIIKDGIIQLEQDYAQRTAALSADGLALDQAKLDQVLKPTKDLIDVYKKELSGEYDTESFKRQSENAMAKAEIMVLDRMSPRAKAMVATSKLFGSAASLVLQSANASEIVDIFAQMETSSQVTQDGLSPSKPADLTVGGQDGEKSARGYLDTVKTMLKFDADGQLDAEQKAELDNQLKSVFKSIDVYGNATQSAQEFQPIIDFLADPNVGAYLAAGGKVPPEFSSKAQQVIQDGYQTQVVPLLKQEMDQTYARSMREVTPGGDLSVRFGDIVEPTMETGRFGFKLKAGVEASREAVAAVKVLNSSAFSKVMNKMIMSNAHMQGNVDYQKSFEQIGPLVFEQQGTGEQSYVDPDVKKTSVDSAGGELDLGDLVETAALEGMDTSTLEGDVNEVAKAIDIGESGGDYGALLGFTNRPGRKFDDVDITKMSINDLLEFSDGSGAYAAYSKRQVGRVATPMGRYQIVGRTLRKLKDELGLTGDEQFTPEMQDKLFLALLRGRGYDKYKAGEMSKEDFMASVSKEWEGLAKSKKSFNALMAAL